MKLTVQGTDRNGKTIDTLTNPDTIKELLTKFGRDRQHQKRALIGSFHFSPVTVSLSGRDFYMSVRIATVQQ